MLSVSVRELSCLTRSPWQISQLCPHTGALTLPLAPGYGYAQFGCGNKRKFSRLREAILFRNSCTVTELPHQQTLNSFSFLKCQLAKDQLTLGYVNKHVTELTQKRISRFKMICCQKKKESVIQKVVARKRILRRHRLLEWTHWLPPPTKKAMLGPGPSGRPGFLSLSPSKQSLSVTNLLWLLSPLFCLRAFLLSAQGKTECPCQEPGTLSSCRVVNTALFLRFCPAGNQTPLFSSDDIC